MSGTFCQRKFVWKPATTVRALRHSCPARAVAGGHEAQPARDRFLNDRKSLLAELDKLNRQADASGSIAAADDTQQQAYEVLLGGGVSKALDLSQEDARTLEMCDTSRYDGGTKWNKVSRGRGGMYNTGEHHWQTAAGSTPV